MQSETESDYIINRFKENPPAPKLNKRGSLAASDRDRSVRLVQLQLIGGAFSTQPVAKKCTNLHILQIGTTSPECTVSRSTSANKPPTPAQHDQLAPTWAPVGSKTAQLGAKLGLFGGSGPNPGQFCRFNATRWTLSFLLLFPPFGGSCKAMLPTLACLGPNFGALCPNTGPSYTSKRAQVAPCWASWAQVGANWPEFGASYAQDGPKWAPVRPTLRPRAAPVGLWLGQVDPLLSSLCSLGAGGSRREATWIMKVQHWNKTLQNKICRSP